MKLKGIRLPPDAYRHRSAWHVTLHCSYGLRPFADEATVRENLEFLRSASDKYTCSVYAYCFMPDHLHLLLDNEGGGNLVQFVRYFKQLTGFAFKKAMGKELWQRRFFDRALRREETVAIVVEYIFNNPVVAGLVDRPDDYAYSGSFVWLDALSGS